VAATTATPRTRPSTSAKTAGPSQVGSEKPRSRAVVQSDTSIRREYSTRRAPNLSPLPADARMPAPAATEPLGSDAWPRSELIRRRSRSAASATAPQSSTRSDHRRQDRGRLPSETGSPSAFAGPTPPDLTSRPAEVGRGAGWLTRTDLAACLALLGITLAFFAPLVLPGTLRRRVVDGDFSHQFFPFRFFEAHEWWSGRIPLWNPDMFAGHPFQADVQ